MRRDRLQCGKQALLGWRWTRATLIAPGRLWGMGVAASRLEKERAMRFRRDDGDDGGFGMGGLGGSFGTSGYDPHGAWEGAMGTRGVMREESRVPHEHADEHPFGGRGYRAYGPPPQREHSGFSNYAGGGDRDRMSYARRPNDHLSEAEARRQAEEWHDAHFTGLAYPTEQSGYGQSQYPYSDIDDRGPHYGKGPKGYKRSDERIREEVCEAMSREGYIDASDVEVTVEGGVVRLAGLVDSRRDKRRPRAPDRPRPRRRRGVERAPASPLAGCLREPWPGADVDARPRFAERQVRPLVSLCYDGR